MTETLITYRLADAPEELTASLPKKAGPWRCLFWIARDGNPAIASLFQSLPEPDIDHVDEALAIASEVAKHLLALDLMPRSVRPYVVGFHTEQADIVEAVLRDAGHKLIPLTDLLSWTPGGGTTPTKDPSETLYFAAMKGDAKACKEALKAGATPTHRDAATGATALHEAASRGDTKVVKLLLEAGAELEAKLKNAKTPPLGTAIEGGHLAIVKRLLAAGARTDVRYGRLGWTPVHGAVSAGASKIVAALIDAGADVTARTKQGKSALELAIQDGHDKGRARSTGRIIEQLIAAGADPSEPNDTGKSALDLAHELGREHLMKFLGGEG